MKIRESKTAEVEVDVSVALWVPCYDGEMPSIRVILNRDAEDLLFPLRELIVDFWESGHFTEVEQRAAMRMALRDLLAKIDRMEPEP